MRILSSKFAPVLAGVLLCASALWPSPGRGGSQPATGALTAVGPSVARPQLAKPPLPGPTDLALPLVPIPEPVSPAAELHPPQHLRLMVVAPHPDDETLGAGGLIRRVRAAGGQVRVVFVTNGDGYVDAVQTEVRGRSPSMSDFLAYGERRHGEALQAIGRLGLARSDAVFLGFPDDGIDDLWSTHWSANNVYTSPTTRADRPPYPEALTRRVGYAGSDLERELGRALRDFQPDWIVVPEPRDRHPDHCTTGVFVLSALRQRRADGAPWALRAQVYTYLVHSPDYPGAPGWLRAVDGAGVGGSPLAGRSLAATRWVSLPLALHEVAAKRDAIAEYRSQVRVMGGFLRQFLRPVEVFGHLDAAQVEAVPRAYAAAFRHAG